MIGEIRRLDPKPGLKFGASRMQPMVPDVYVRPGARWRLACRTQQRHAAAGAGQSDLLHRAVEDDPQGRRQILFHRLPAERDLAGARARPARPHHPESRDRDRAPAGRLLHPRRRASAAAQSQGGGGRDPDARIDGVAGHRQQIHGDQSRQFRIEVFLHRLDRVGRRRRGPFGGSGPSPHQAIDRCGEPGRDLVRRHHRGRLRESGIDIARRTVAKYREAMRIPSSVQRRRDKQAAGPSAPAASSAGPATLRRPIA